MSRAEVVQFFDAYRDCFNRLDGHAVADMLHTPSAITHAAPGASPNAELTLWPDDAPMRANMLALCNVYRNAGFHRADFVLTQWVSLGAHHAFAVLDWTLWRADGSVLQQFRTGYNLLRTAHGPKVLLVTQFEEDLTELKAHAA